MASGIFNTKDLGEALRSERLARGLSQAQLAQAAGLPRQRISEIERGENTTILLMLRALGALGKGLKIVDIRPEAGEFASLFEEDRGAA